MKLRLSIFCAAVLSAAVFLTCGSISAQNSSSLGLHTVVIDPGHGGTDPGALSKDKKVQEKQLVFDISRKLKEKIEKEHPEVKVYLTREKDVLVPLIDRAKFATSKGADLFISVHINANERTTPNGYSIHLLGQSTDKNKDTYAFNMDVCKRENEVILLEDDYSTTYQGFDPRDPESDIFLHLMHNAYREQSLIFAQFVDQEMKNSPIKKSNGISQNNFAVLRQASMPAVLLELGFISNPSDLAVLKMSSSADKIVNCLSSAFTEYKKFYDESVGAGAKEVKAAPAKEPEKEKSEVKEEVNVAVEKAEEPAVSESPEYYGTQVLASAKIMEKDNKFFQGYEVRSVKMGNLYKYVAGCSEDLDKARELSKEIMAKFNGAFLVKVDDSGCTRAR